jgi:2-succinyl-5-enolpyruvyl-6-hydroxy-3-cyclohexene-1-carboxylate synthase
MLNEKVKLLKMSIRTVVLVRTGGQLIDPMRTAKHAMICHVKDFLKILKKKKKVLKLSFRRASSN